MRMNVFEMEGFLRGRCVPRDLKVNETDAEYLVDWPPESPDNQYHLFK